MSYDLLREAVKDAWDKVGEQEFRTEGSFVHSKRVVSALT